MYQKQAGWGCFVFAVPMTLVIFSTICPTKEAFCSPDLQIKFPILSSESDCKGRTPYSGVKFPIP